MEPLRPSRLSASPLTRVRRMTVSDLIYLGGGVALLLLFAAYASLLRRA